MMATMITSEEVECRNILNDVGIFFAEDSGLLDTEDFNCDDDFMAIVPPTSTIPKTTNSVSVPVSPTVMPAPTSLQPLAPTPLRPPEFPFPTGVALLPPPMLPSIMPTPPTVMSAAATIQRAVTDLSMTSSTRAMPTMMPTTTITTTNNQKRSLQQEGMPQADLGDPLDLDEQSRRKRNREHAKKSRQRKKALTDDLRSTVEALRQETEKLRQELYAAIGEKEVMAILEERKRKEREEFIANLQQPKNRVVNASALKFLKGLSKKLPKEGFKESS